MPKWKATALKRSFVMYDTLVILQKMALFVVSSKLKTYVFEFIGFSFLFSRFFPKKSVVNNS